MLPSKSGYAIMFIVLGMFFISVNDMVIKRFSGAYPLHQMVFLRSAIGMFFTLILIQLEGGWRILKTDQPRLHALRAVMVFASNMTYFAALAVLPLPDATALFFIVPIMITVLSIPILGERVGPRRWGAVIVGFCGTLIMVRAQRSTRGDISIWIYLLPILAAFFLRNNASVDTKAGKNQSIRNGTLHPDHICPLLRDQRLDRWQRTICRQRTPPQFSLSSSRLDCPNSRGYVVFCLNWHSCDRSWILPIPSLSQCACRNSCTV